MSLQMYDHFGHECEPKDFLRLLDGYTFKGNISLVCNYKAGDHKPWKFRFELWIAHGLHSKVFEGEGSSALRAVAEGTTKYKKYLSEGK